MADYEDPRLKELQGKYNVPIEQEDAEKLERLRNDPMQNENYDSYLRDIEAKQQRRQSNTPGGGGGGGGNSNPGMATAQYSGAQSNPQLDALLSLLQGQQQQAAAHQASMRGLLMGQLSSLQQPVSLTDPGIAGAASAHRNALQRSSEQQRRELAERRAYDGSGGAQSGAFQTDVDRLNQLTGESQAGFEGNLLFNADQQRAQRLQSLLQTALALGDSESARNIQAQLQAIGMGQQNNQYYAGLNQNNNQFQDDMAFRYAGLNANNNMQALMAMLGAF